MREAVWTDPEGRMWRTLIPSDDPDENAPMGVVFCPVDLSPLGLPLGIEVAIHNKLFHLRIGSYEDAAARPDDIARAIRSVLRIDVKRIQDLYRVE